jgi:YkoY family integral membrane protein
MESLIEILHRFLGPDLKAAGIIILNLLLIESLLSVDNAAVLATMVMDLPKDQRSKALKYGILGAYAFRGLCLVFATYLVKFVWLKALGGLYLVWLTIDYFRKKARQGKEDQTISKEERKIYQKSVGLFGTFWSTVILVEIMDLAFSIDNVFAAVAFSNNIYLIIIGVFIGILAMRFVAQGFIRLMEKFIFLETVAFIVIAVLGVKLLVSSGCDYFPANPVCVFLNGHEADLYLSIFTASMFLVPVLTSLVLDVPKRKKREEKS